MLHHIQEVTICIHLIIQQHNYKQSKVTKPLVIVRSHALNNHNNKTLKI